MKITINESLSKRYGIDEYHLQAYSIYAQNGDETKRFRLREGEPEDMIFGRNLQGPGSIEKMLRMAHEAGVNGEKLEIKHTEEKW